MDELLAELEAVPRNDDFRYALNDLTDGWRAGGVGLDGVKASLVFIEAHPDLDYGMPGALVHFAEEYYRKGYEAALLESFARRPTILTAWMVHRLLNGARDAAERNVYVAAFERAGSNPVVTDDARAEIDHYLAISR